MTLTPLKNLREMEKKKRLRERGTIREKLPSFEKTEEWVEPREPGGQRVATGYDNLGTHV